MIKAGLIVFILGASVAVQAAAAVMAFRLMGITGRRGAWICISGALTLMAVRRAIVLSHVLMGDVSQPPDIINEAVGLVLSVLMLVGVALIAPLFRERKSLEDRLATLAHYDALTAIPNRVLFSEKAGMGILHARRSGKLCAILFIDLDHFKSVNDALGHSAGDELLKDTVLKLSACVRDVDVISRQGGDEFIVFLSDLENALGAQHVAERLLELCNAPRMIAGNELFITASVGIAVFPNDGNSLEDLLKHADAAMYAAKQSGRNRFRFFDPEMNRNAVARIRVEKDLRDALGKKEFVLYYQPVVRMSDGKVRGFEALIRFVTPSGEVILPDEFIAVAEETGLVVSMGEWALDEACRFIRKLVDAGHIDMRVSVNISVVQLRRKNLAAVIQGAIDRYGLRPELLEVEVTESLFIESFDEAIEILNSIRAIGVHVSLDDFGTGYSSLLLLQKLPITNLKIDQLFIREIDKDSEQNAIIPAIIDLAHQLKLGVIAEGVETDIQWERLARKGCDYYQGFLLSRPMPEAEAMLFLEKECRGFE